MSVGEDQQSNVNRRSRSAWLRLGRRHTFLLGLLLGAMGAVGAMIVAMRAPSFERPIATASLTEMNGAADRLSETAAAPPRRADAAAPHAMGKAQVAGASTGITKDPPARVAGEPPGVTEDPPLVALKASARGNVDEIPTIDNPPLVEPRPLPPHFRVALTTRAAPENLKYTLPVPDVVVRAGVLKRNEFIATILSDAGATLAAQDELFRSLRGKFDFRLARPGQRYRVEVDHQGQVVAFEYRAAVDEVYRVRRTDNDTLAAKRVDIPLTRDVVQVDGEITKSLWDAFIDAGESPALAMELAEAYRFDIDFFHDTRKNDKFRLFVEKFSNDEGELVRYGRIYAAEYVGAPYSPVGTKRLFWFAGRKTKGYYDEKGKAAQRAFLRSPLKFTRVSSPFGYRRHPILGRRHFHGGVDYAAPTGTPVQAVASGRVTFAGRKGPNGNMVRIRHDGGYESYYLHLSRYHVRKGQRVSQSTVIGRVGSTGRSTGPHLDFRLKKNGRYINPRQNVAPRTKRVAKADRASYYKTIKPWMTKLDDARGG